jgi:hypothetical protein
MIVASFNASHVVAIVVAYACIACVTCIVSRVAHRRRVRACVARDDVQRVM